MNMLNCPSCGTELTNLTNFCPNCGDSLRLASNNKTRITPVRFFLLVLVSLGIFLFAWMTQSKLAGKKPEKMFTASASSGGEMPQDVHANMDMSGAQNINVHGAGMQDTSDPELNKARDLAKAKPLDVDLQKNLSKLLLNKIRGSEIPAQEIVFEEIDTLRNILNLNPNDSESLIAMADISFEQQAFDKSVQYYEKYLSIEKNDLNAKARYASALTFIGKNEQALANLASILKADPKNFHAKAYTAITYAQMGKTDQAKKFGKEALDLAPSPEARSRFSEFLKQLDSEKNQPAKSNQTAESVQNTQNDQSESNIVKYIKENAVAGTKYRSFEVRGSELVINFSDFPIQNMPPFVRDKFLNTLKEVAKNDAKQFSKIIFRDISTNQEIYTLIL